MSGKMNKLLALTAAVLAALSVVLFMAGRDSERPVVDSKLFAIEETEKIDRVQMIRKGDTVTLSFDDGKWKVNHRWDADVQMIKVLMATLRQQAPHRPAAAAIADTVNKRLNESGTHVIVSKSGQSELEFDAGGNRAKSEAWFRKTGTSQSYVMMIPGYRVYVSGIFELGVSGWRNKRVFDFNWRNFKSLTASYLHQPADGFTVEMKQRYFGIRGLDPVDTTRLNDYLDAVSLLMARRFVDNADSVARRVMEGQPSAQVEIRDIADRTYRLELYTPRSIDNEVFARLADGETVAFDRGDVAAILRKRNWFKAAQR